MQWCWQIQSSGLEGIMIQWSLVYCQPGILAWLQGNNASSDETDQTDPLLYPWDMYMWPLKYNLHRCGLDQSNKEICIDVYVLSYQLHHFMTKIYLVFVSFNNIVSWRVLNWIFSCYRFNYMTISRPQSVLGCVIAPTFTNKDDTNVPEKYSGALKYGP